MTTFSSYGPTGHTHVLRSSGFMLLAALMLFLPPALAEERFWQAGLDYVDLVTVDKAGVSNDHPLDIGPAELSRLLSTIQLREEDWNDNLDLLGLFSDDSDKGEDTALFNQDEVRKLARPLASALAQATSKQDVIFQVSSSHKRMLGSGTSTTTGRIFVNQGQFNLILGNLRVDLGKRYQMRGGYSDVAEKVDYLKLRSFKLDSGSRLDEADIDAKMVTGDYHQLKPVRGKVRQDWMQIDLLALREGMAQRQQQQQKVRAVAEDAESIREQARSIDANQARMEQRLQQLEQQVGQPAAAPAPGAGKSVEQRLTELKTLHDKGMIPDDLYRQRMEEILKDL